jgi:RHS repeat-associated protein
VTAGTRDNTHRFTGHERDVESGLDYMLARYYTSTAGRFLSVDPASQSIDGLNPQSWNRYSYTLNNPLKFIDPTGEDPYLAARPLGNDPGSKYQHMFVVSNARFLGDPQATVYSWGQKDNGNMGRVDNTTQNDQSKGTSQSDQAAWLSLGQPGSQASATPIPATDQQVDESANSVLEDQDYSAATSVLGINTGVNSNSAAQAVANDAAGKPVSPPGTRTPRGAEAAGRVQFDKNKDGKPDPKPAPPPDKKKTP